MDQATYARNFICLSIVEKGNPNKIGLWSSHLIQSSTSSTKAGKPPLPQLSLQFFFFNLLDSSKTVALDLEKVEKADKLFLF